MPKSKLVMDIVGSMGKQTLSKVESSVGALEQNSSNGLISILTYLRKYVSQKEWGLCRDVRRGIDVYKWSVCLHFFSRVRSTGPEVRDSPMLDRGHCGQTGISYLSQLV